MKTMLVFGFFAFLGIGGTKVTVTCESDARNCTIHLSKKTSTNPLDKPTKVTVTMKGDKTTDVPFTAGTDSAFVALVDGDYVSAKIKK